MGLVAYRDIGDEYVTKTFNLTTDIQDLYANLLELQGARRRRLARKRQRGAGGRRHQAVLDARRRKSAASCSWSATRRRTWTMRRTPNIRRCMRMARDRGIIVNAVQAGGARDTERVWREIAQTRQWPLHPDPAGRRPSRHHRDAVGHRDHRAAGPHQRHGHPLRAARAALERRAEDQAGRGGAALGRVRDGGLSQQAAAAARPAQPSPAAAISSPTCGRAARSSTA